MTFIPGSGRPKGVESDTGVVGLDWLTVTLDVNESAAVVDLVEPVLGKGSYEQRGGNFYKSRYQFIDGAALFFSPNEAWVPGLSAQAFLVPHCSLDIKGSALALLSPDDLLDLCRQLSFLGGRATRIDVRFDDYKRRINPRELFSRYAEPGKLSPFRTFSLVDSGSSAQTLYLGRRGKEGGGKQLVVYDKASESDGTINSVRWEARFYKDHADEVLRKISRCGDVESFGSLLGSLVAGSVTFYEDDGGDGVHLDRRTVAPFWRGLVDELGFFGCRSKGRKPPT